MAENKYDLLLVPTKLDKAIKPQPWYKERLRTKYLKQNKRSAISETLIGQNWVLIKSGVDDFRDGKPIDFQGKFVVEGNKGISPVIKSSKDSTSSRLLKDGFYRNYRPSLTKSQICLDKRLPQQRQRQDNIDEVEFGLSQHPLALYPHLEEGMPPELFEEIVDLLDPAMNPETESEADNSESTEQPSTSQGSLTKINEPSAKEDEESVDSSDSKDLRNPYKWILHKESNQKDDKKGVKKRPTSPSQDEHIKKVTKDFCDWVSNLGGDSNNVEESTIMSLFASGYETKPALSVPIHVVELSHVPLELRISAGITTPASAAKKSQPTSAATSAPPVERAVEEDSDWVKVKYGAWYLPPESWKPRGEHELLQDPDELAKKDMSESKKKSEEMDMQLAPLHGARAFRDFLEKNGKRKPDFMERVSVMQDDEDSKNEVGVNFKQKLQASPSITLSRARSVVSTNSGVSMPEGTR